MYEQKFLDFQKAIEHSTDFEDVLMEAGLSPDLKAYDLWRKAADVQIVDNLPELVQISNDDGNIRVFVKANPEEALAFEEDLANEEQMAQKRYEERMNQYKNIGDMLDESGYYGDADQWDSVTSRIAKLYSDSFVKIASTQDKEDLEDQLFIDSIKIASRIDEKDYQLADYIRQVTAQSIKERMGNWMRNMIPGRQQANPYATQEKAQQQDAAFRIQKAQETYQQVVNAINTISQQFNQVRQDFTQMKNNANNLMYEISEKIVENPYFNAISGKLPQLIMNYSKALAGGGGPALQQLGQEVKAELQRIKALIQKGDFQAPEQQIDMSAIQGTAPASTAVNPGAILAPGTAPVSEGTPVTT